MFDSSPTRGLVALACMAENPTRPRTGGAGFAPARHAFRPPLSCAGMLRVPGTPRRRISTLPDEETTRETHRSDIRYANRRRVSSCSP